MNRVVLAVLLSTVWLAGCADDGVDEAEPAPHREAVEVAGAYLDALADADVKGLCETYASASQQAEFDKYDVSDCAAYEVAFIRDSTSGYRATDTMESTFETGEATGDDAEVRVAFTGTLTYLGDNPAAIDFYEANPTVTGEVVVVRDDEEWAVDAEATQESY